MFRCTVSVQPPMSRWRYPELSFRRKHSATLCLADRWYKLGIFFKYCNDDPNWGKTTFSLLFYQSASCTSLEERYLLFFCTYRLINFKKSYVHRLSHRFSFTYFFLLKMSSFLMFILWLRRFFWFGWIIVLDPLCCLWKMH